MDVRLLGPVEIHAAGGDVALTASRTRALLLILALRAGTTVSRDELIDAVWGDEPPPTAPKLVQIQISHLRRALDEAGEPDRITTRSTGYQLAVDPDELDVARAAALIAAARDALERSSPDGQAHAALRLWRGTPLEDLADGELARRERERLADLRREALELAARADLERNRFEAALSLLDALATEDPLRERTHELRMLTLYRAGRQSAALDAYNAYRRRLVDELGLEPGPVLRRLQNAILRQDEDLLPASDNGGVARMPATRRIPSRRAVVAAIALLLAAVLAIVLVRGSATDETGATGLRADSVVAIDAAGGRVIADVPVGTGPRDVVAAEGSIWVANATDASLSRIDPRRRVVVRTFAPGGSLAALAVADSRAWTLDGGRERLSRLDPRFGDMAHIRLPHLVNPFWLPGDRVGLAVAHGRVVAGDGRAGVVVLDARTGRRLQRRSVGFFPSAIAIRGDEIWLADPVGRQVTRIDATGAMTSVPVDGQPVALAAGPRGVWVADGLGRAVLELDPRRPAVRATIPVGGRPESLALDGSNLWVATGPGQSVVRIDARTDRVMQRVPLHHDVAGVAAADGLVWASLRAPAPWPAAASGRVRVAVEDDPPSNDPALDLFPIAWRLADAMCAFLVTHPDAEGRAGTRLVPDLARAMPHISRAGRTYTFRIRRGFRFSPPSGAAVTAASMKHSIERALDPRLGGDAASYVDELVGERAFREGRVHTISGIDAHGDRLTFHLAHPSPAFLTKLAMPYFCAVPGDAPARRGLDGIPTAGPYFIASHARDRMLTLRRNPSYGGTRPRRPAEIDLLFGVPRGEYAAAVRSGRADDATDVPPADIPRGWRLDEPMLALRYLRLNATRPLFADPRMRRAVNLAVDRTALATAPDMRPPIQPTDQYIPPSMPGYRDVHASPLAGPDLRRARRLAGGPRHRATLITGDDPQSVQVATLVRRQLAAIGIAVSFRKLSPESFFTGKLGRWDLSFLETWYDDYADPSEFTNNLFEPRFHQFGVATPPALAQRLRGVGAISPGPARWRAYARLDAQLSRRESPFIPIGTPLIVDAVSPRVGCRIAQPVYGLDLAALCVKRP